MFKNIDKPTKILFVIFIIVDILALGMSMSWQSNYNDMYSDTEIEVSE